MAKWKNILNDDDDDEFGPHQQDRRMLALTNGYFDFEGLGEFGFRRGYTPYVPKTEKDYEAYEFLKSYSQVFNLYAANTVQSNPISNKALYIIDVLSKLGIKFRVDIFPYDGYNYSYASDLTSHRLVNIIAEPNPEIAGAAVLFCAHHDVANPRSENCQDNGASVCHLLRLASLIQQNPQESQRTILLFSDCEETGARGARRFAKHSDFDSKNPAVVTHKVFGDIEAVVNLELTGHGDVIWTDCHGKAMDSKLHKRLETAAQKQLPKLHTPPSDVIAFRESKFPALCIGTLPQEDMDAKTTWSLCHRLTDTFDKCDEDDMTAFTQFLLQVTKVKLPAPPPITQLTMELQ